MGFQDNISSEDRQRVRDIKQAPEFAPGFEGGGGGDSMSDFDGGDDFGSMFGDNSSDGFDFGGDSGGGFDFGGDSGSSSGEFGSLGGGSSSSFGGAGGGSTFGNTAFGNNGFGNNAFGNTGFGSMGGMGPFGQNPMQQQQSQVNQKDGMDKLFDAGAETLKASGTLMLEMFKSIKTRNADDWGFLSRNMIMTSFFMIPASILLGIVGQTQGINFISFGGMPLQTLLAGGLSLGTGISGLGTAAFILSKAGDSDMAPTDAVPDIPPSEDNFTEAYEENLGDELDDLFGDDFDDLFNDEIEVAEDAEKPEVTVDFKIEDEPEVEIDFDKLLEDVGENKVITRQTLFDTFKPMLPTNTPKFADVEVIDNSSDLFETLETICLKALANLANCQLEEVNSHLESAKETMFSYELRLKRINKVKKTDDLAREMEVYMRDNSDDDSVNASVSIEGDFYKIIVTKGEAPVVTFGDIFKKDYCCEFYTNTKKKLPMVVGINELGEVIIDDAKNFDTMLIAGKPRSGKSWYVLAILMSLMLFNSPELVQFLIVDPKKSNLFKTMSLMPHVFGLHDDSNILDLLQDVIEVEAPRRKQLLSDNRCDDIWALWDKGIYVPILYVVIDEYITVLNNLDKDQQKEFDAKIQTLISQLPSQGIRLLFVPHRATGIVNKTNRTMLQYTAAVRADVEDVKDTLGIQKWDRALTKPGDTAVKTSSMKNAMYVRGAALTISDGKNSEFIETAAKAFYKMGVELPDMSNMRIACNRDEDWIQGELGGGGKKIQFNVSRMEADASGIDLSTVF